MKRFIIIILLLSFSSCATPNYGTFTKMHDDHKAIIAKDIAKIMFNPFPPANTVISFGIVKEDSMVTILDEELRATGYAVHNFTKSEEGDILKVKPVIVKYILDELYENQYRIQLLIEDLILTRLYVMSDGKLQAESNWARTEVKSAEE